MANQNQKIIINEVDATTPRGSGASSDVVYVPGLAVDKFLTGEKKNSDGTTTPIYTSTPKNTPVLCTTVAEFEATFGPSPYLLSSADIDYIEDNKLGELADASVSDDTEVNTPSNQRFLDRSYIYAKELINAGLSVVYENIDPENVVIEAGVVSAESDKLAAIGSNVFEYTSCKKEKDEIIHTCKIKLDPTYDKDTGRLNSTGRVRVELDTSSFADTCLSCSFELTSPEGSIFTIKEGNIIEWSGAAEVLSFNTPITCTVKTKYSPNNNSKEGDIYTFAIHIINTLDTSVLNPDSFASGSRVEYMRTELKNHLPVLEDKNAYSIKYVTSGGYPAFVNGNKDLANALINVAYNRGDCVAIIDHEDDINEKFVGADSLYERACTGSFSHPEFGAMFTPWGVYTTVCNYGTETHSQLGDGKLSVKRGSFVMPASFGYFLCLAAAIKTGPNFIAMAGVARGVVGGLQKLHPRKTLTNVIAEDYQPKYGAKTSINAITNIRPYGLTIWGNRTLLSVADKGSVALNFLNVRNMVSDIKKVAYDTAKVCMFEQETDTLWLKFKSGVSPLLEQLKSGSGIKDYKIIKLPTKYNGSQLSRGEMSAVIKIFPVYPVEFFEITVVITDDDVSVS